MMAVVWKEFKTMTTSAMSVMLHFIAPLFLLVFFATVLGRNLASFSYGGSEVDYLVYFTPGLIGYVTFMTFQMALTFIRHDRMSGILGIVVLAQGGLGGYIGGKMTAQVTINTIKSAALVLLSLLIAGGTTALGNIANMGLMLVVIVLGSAVWLLIGLSVAFILKRDDIREILMMLISMPLIFSSSMYYDVSLAPGWIRLISVVNPLTYTCNLARQAYLNESIGSCGVDLIVLAAMTVVALGCALFVSRRAEY